MPEPLLLSKLYIPPTRLNTVLRPRLVARLNEGMHGRLILISAPAGFGKTTLLSEWIAGREWPVAWLSLDAGESDPARFLAYFVSALQTIDENCGKDLLAVLHAPQPQPPAIESLLAGLLNEISTITSNFVLVLDDYHALDSKAVDQALTFLVEHQPPQMQLVIATREDPPLPLARLRVRGKLTELRAADLRFTPAEAAAFLNGMMGLKLSDVDIAALEARTEGWIAGLQLAALSMRGRADTSGFIRSFTGSHRFVLDYLAGEVLEKQPEHVRSFLLQTAVLDRLHGPLCDAVTAQAGGRDMLETLERDNLFVVPLDDQRQWYRYHHLFADVLRAHLMEAQPDHVAGLHQRASAWYAQNGFAADAIRHALAAADYVNAAGLIELAWSAMDISYQSATWLGWVKALPDALLRDRPVLSVGYAWALLDSGELEASEALLRNAERCLETPTHSLIVKDMEQFRSLPASIATARAYRALALGDVTATVQFARQALERTPADDWIRQLQAASLLGLAQYTSGDVVAAERSLADLYANLLKRGDVLTLIGIAFLLADIRVVLGRLRDAESCYQQALHLAIVQSGSMPLGTADLYRGLAELCIERDDLEAAAQHLTTSQMLGEQTALTDWPHRLCITQARLKEAQGDMAGALALLDEAERVHVRGPLPDVRPVAALKACVWLRQGRLAEALEWARTHGLSADDDMRFTREFEHMTLARLLIAASKGDREAACLNDATRLLDRLLHAAETGRRMGSAIQILLLQALAFSAQANQPRAHASLARALTLAEPEGYLRTFMDEGEAMRLLIERQARNRNHPRHGYADRLLAAFTHPLAAPKAGSSPQKSAPAEPLSARELEVLRLLRSELSGPEIAQQLIVSLNTLRTHTKSIFNKLGVNNRRAAIHRAEELDLF